MVTARPETQQPEPAEEPREGLLKALPGHGTVGEGLVSSDSTVFAGDYLSPVAMLKSDAVDHNIATMADYCERAGVLLAPHGKTTMCPQLIARQLGAGAWAVTAATGSHIRAYRSFGVRRILLANELVDPATIAWAAADLSAAPDWELWCYADSVVGVELLDTGLQATDTDVRFDVLVEVGTEGGRTGCRTVEEATTVARAVAASPRLRLRGVSGYEGGIGPDREPRTLAAVADFCRRIGRTAEVLDDAGLFDPSAPFVVLSAGGSVYFDVVAAELSRVRLPNRPVRVVLRSGCYVTHDHGLYARISPFEQPDSPWHLEPAFEIWGRILSRPEPRLAYADFGRRDVPFDSGLPVPLTVRSPDGAHPRPATEVEVRELNDQHAFLTVPPDSRIRPGDWLGCGISHPCTAFDKWRCLPMVDGDYRVTEMATTYL